VGLPTVLPFGVRLLTLLFAVTLSHETDLASSSMLPEAAEPLRRDPDTVSGKGEARTQVSPRDNRDAPARSPSVVDA
jgi:hypothetical protein